MDSVWDRYTVFDPEIDKPAGELSAAEARAHYQLVMDSKEQRIGELRRLSADIGVTLDGTDASLQRLNDWFVANVERDPDRPNQARGRWLSIAHDLSIYIAELIREKHPHIDWRLEKSKRDLSYQRPVLVGFRGADSTYAMDLYFALTQYAGGLVRGEEGERDYFVELRRWADSIA